MPSDNGSPLVELLNRARAGDEAAREKLFVLCRDYVGVVARAQVGSWLQAKVDASDLVQQTLLDMHRGLAEFRGETEAEWLAWLRQILNHNATDYVRQYQGTKKRQAHREVSLDRSRPGESDARPFDPKDPGESPSQCVLRRERELEVARALAQLPLDYQEVIELRNLQRLSFEEVAERLGRSRGAVQMLWMRALRKLEEILKRPSDVQPH
jgi:RNA polymerase sigma-70 factor (ECF subfamily)